METDDKTHSTPDDEQGSAVDPLASFVESFASHFIDHPGFMWTGGGFAILHANWPAYPSGHGLMNAVSTLADFPSDTKFFHIDNIDQCSLFIADEIPPKNEFDKKYYHIALWDEDLRELAQKDFIDDTSVVDGQVEFHNGYLSLSAKGQHAILVNELTYDIHPRIMDLVEDYLFDHRYDTAVREAALLVETHLREFSGTERYGQELIDYCFGNSSKLLPVDLPNTNRLENRGTFRRFFNYVRNDFAHNFSSISLVTTCRLLRRCSHLLELIDQLRKLKPKLPSS